MRIKTVHIVHLFCLLSLHTQIMYGQLPQTDIYLCEVKWNQKNILTKTPVLINNFNGGNYNNQPSFIDYQNFFITVGHKDSTTDIFHINLDKREYYTFTSTIGISEFSAQLTPDKQSVSVVRIEEDGKTQTLWLYPSDRSHYGKNLLPSITNVGYHVWLENDRAALFLVDSIPKLAIANTKTGTIKVIQENIGRCLKFKNGILYFTVKDDNKTHKIKKYDHKEQTIQNVGFLPKNVEDFEVLINGNILFGEGHTLKVYNTTGSSEITPLLSLEKYGIHKINRIVVERDRILFVNQKL